MQAALYNDFKTVAGIVTI